MNDLNVPDVLTVEVPATGQVLVVSDLHLSPAATAAATWAGRDLSDRLESWSGAGVLVLAGDVLELLGPDVADPAAVLAAHPRLTASICTFAQGEGRRVVYLVGNHDARLA